VTDPPNPARLDRFPGGRNRGEGSSDVGWTEHVHRCAKEVGTRFGHSQREIAAGGESEDPDALRIRDPMMNRPLDRIDRIVACLQSVLVIACVEECLAVPRRAAILDLQYGVAAVD